MWPHLHDDGSESQPDPLARLAAYVDGELSEEERACVEDLLARDPDARAAVQAQRQLQSWCERGAVSEPDARTWDGLFDRMETALAARKVPTGPPHAPRRRTGRGWPLAVAVIAAAASVLLALWVGSRKPDDSDARPFPRGTEGGDTVEALDVASDSDVVIHEIDPVDSSAVVVGQVPVAQPFEFKPGEPLPVAEESDVVIISMDGADTTALVVGEPPISGPLVLASPGEVSVEHIAPHPIDEMVPSVHAPRDGWPMVVSPLKAVSRAGKE